MTKMLHVIDDSTVVADAVSDVKLRFPSMLIAVCLATCVCFLSGSTGYALQPDEDAKEAVEEAKEVAEDVKEATSGEKEDAKEGGSEESKKKKDEVDDKNKDKTDGKKDEKKADEKQPSAPHEKLDPRIIRFHLLDGTIVTGKLNVGEISVQTDFGKLNIPVDKIKAFRPGLKSYKTMKSMIDKLVEGLGSDDYNTRQKSHRELSNLGMKISNIIGEYKDGGNAERKRHLEEIRKEIEELSEEMDEDSGAEYDDRPWIDGDEVVTEAFTVVGKIEKTAFLMESKYGTLNVALTDVSFGDRPTMSKPEIRKSVTIPGTQIAQSSFKSTLIRVQRGDVVNIRADGQIVMTPWGSDEISTPDGGNNFGWYRSGEIEAGSLVGKIGNSGKVFKVGVKSRIVCKSSGILNLAIGMNPDYSSGYNYPGQYNVKIVVEPN